MARTFAGRIAVLLLCSTSFAAAPGDWPQWRGPNRDGVSAERDWFRAWGDAGPAVVWRAKVGEGFAAVSVAGGRVYVAGNAKGKDTVYCLDAASGKPVWTHAYECPGAGGGFPGPAVSPTVDGDLLYTQSRVGHLFCLRASDGTVVWAKDPKELKISRGASFWHGASCHPLVEGDLLIVETGGRKGVVTAFDKRTGQVAWEAGDEKLGYAAPIAGDIDGRRTIVAFTGTGPIGLDPKTGQVLWRYPCRIEFQCAIATPLLAGGGRVFVSSSYMKPGSTMLEVKGGQARAVWETREFRTHAAPAVLWEGHLYGFDGSIEDGGGAMECVDAATGKVTWSAEGMGVGGLMAADGKLIVLSQDGELVIAEASPKGFKALARSRVLAGKCWNMPVLAGGRIYVRNQRGDVVCVDARGPGKS